jgi:hypothetical protein
MLASMPTPRAYSLKQAEIITTFTRATWYRWEKLGYVRLIRVANKTLVPAEEIDRVMAGEAVPHVRAGWRRGQPPKPRRLGRPRKVQIPPKGAETRLRPEIPARRVVTKRERAAREVGTAEDNTPTQLADRAAMLVPPADLRGIDACTRPRHPRRCRAGEVA